MKKIVLVLVVLSVVVGIAFASKTKTKNPSQPQQSQKTCSICGKVIYYGSKCSDCMAAETKQIEAMNQKCTPNSPDGKQTDWQKENCR